MALSIKPLSCNGACGSCYEAAITAAAGAQPEHYDIEAAIKRLEESGEKRYPSIHGGEPLLLGRERMGRLLQYSMDKFGGSGIQTNGLLIDQEWVDLFKRHRTCVGVSIDGDTPELNMGRWNKNAITRANAEAGTNRAMEAIAMLTAAGIRTSAIIVLRRYNAGNRARLAALLRFLHRLEGLGIYDVRTNPGIVFDPARREEEELTPDELAAAFETLATACFEDPRRMWQPYRDAVDLMLGNMDATCNFTGCDPHATGAEIPILADGSLTNCLKPGLPTIGIPGLRADKRTYARQEALHDTPQEMGGCAGCRYWSACQGGCPGEAIDNDFRNRTRFCAAYLALFQHTEHRLRGLMPNIELQSEHQGTIPREAILQSITATCGSSWRKDRRRPVQEQEAGAAIGNRDHGDSHGDSHGDAPHGDHTDRSEALHADDHSNARRAK